MNRILDILKKGESSLFIMGLEWMNVSVAVLGTRDTELRDVGRGRYNLVFP